MSNETGLLIKRLRKEKGYTQASLAEKLYISDKTVSKWERGESFPDIEMLKPLCKVLDISLTEFFDGALSINNNLTGNMLKSKFYYCPVCGNIITSSGEAVVSCHGIRLHPLKAKEDDRNINIEKIQDQYYVTIDSPMVKDDYITSIIALRSDGVEIRKLYPEMKADAYFRIDGIRFIYVLDSKGNLIHKNKRNF